jgi:hypothetical protein
MEPENLQTKCIAEAVESFISAAIPSHIIQSFRLSRICFVKHDKMLRCQVRTDHAGRPWHSVQRDIPGLDQISADSDDKGSFEELVFTEECAELQKDLTSD